MPVTSDRTLIISDQLAIQDEENSVAVRLYDDSSAVSSFLQTELMRFEKLHPPRSLGDGQGNNYYRAQPKVLMKHPTSVPNWLKEQVGSLGYDIVTDESYSFTDEDTESKPTVDPGRRRLEDDSVPDAARFAHDDETVEQPDTNTASNGQLDDELRETHPGVDATGDRSTAAGSRRTQSSDATTDTTDAVDEEVETENDDTEVVESTRPEVGRTAAGGAADDESSSACSPAESPVEWDDDPEPSDPDTTTDDPNTTTDDPNTTADDGKQELSDAELADVQPTFNEITEFEPSRIHADFDLGQLEGVGSVSRDKLKDAGIDAIEQLQLATVDQIASISGIGTSKARNIKDQVGSKTPDEVDGFSVSRRPATA